MKEIIASLKKHRDFLSGGALSNERILLYKWRNVLGHSKTPNNTLYGAKGGFSSRAENARGRLSLEGGRIKTFGITAKLGRKLGGGHSS